MDAGGFEGRLTNHNPIYYLATQCWFDNDPSLLYAPLHRDKFCKSLLEHYLAEVGEYSGFELQCQRESFKSTFTHGVFASFIAFRGKHVHGRDERTALIHHKEDQASLNLVQLKLKSINHPWIKEVWPGFHSNTDYGTKTRFDWPCKVEGITEVPSILAAGLGSRLTGFHFDWMLYSDPVTDEHIDSKLVRDEAFNKYQASRYMLDTLRGKEVIDGTPYHIHDLHAKLIKANVGGKKLYKQLIISACDENYENLSFPTRHTKEFLKRRRREEIASSGNDFLWHLQYRCQAKASGLIATKPEWLKFCKSDVPPKNCWHVLIVDPAWKGGHNSGKGDWAAGGVWVFEQRGILVLRYLIDGFHSNTMTSLDGEREMFRLMKTHGIVDVAVEEHGGYTFRGRLEEAATQRGMFINLIDLKSKQTNKQERIVNFLNHVQAGHVIITDDCPIKSAFIEQFDEFPQCLREHDDILDMAGYSCDPKVIELCGPVFTSEIDKTPFWARVPEPQPVMRTRYTSL